MSDNKVITKAIIFHNHDISVTLLIMGEIRLVDTSRPNPISGFSTYENGLVVNIFLRLHSL